MTVSLDTLIAENRELLVDLIVKDAVRQIPSYADAPLRLTIDRVERALDALAGSIRENDPTLLESHLKTVGGERRKEGYAVGELHSIVQIIERHLRALILGSDSPESDQNALLALLDAVMGAARMVLSVTYIVAAMGTE
jgi:hypothetical protein